MIYHHLLIVSKMEATMSTITTRAMHRRNTGTGFFHKKQARKVRKGVPNGRYIKVAGGLAYHPTKGRVERS